MNTKKVNITYYNLFNFIKFIETELKYLSFIIINFFLNPFLCQLALIKIILS